MESLIERSLMTGFLGQLCEEKKVYERDHTQLYLIIAR